MRGKRDQRRRTRHGGVKVEALTTVAVDARLLYLLLLDVIAEANQVLIKEFTTTAFVVGRRFDVDKLTCQRNRVDGHAQGYPTELWLSSNHGRNYPDN